MPFSNREKYEELLREMKIRKRIYPRWVAEKRMTQELAEERIALMEEMAEEYRNMFRRTEMLL